MGHKLKVILTVILIASLGIFLSSGLQFYDTDNDAGSSLGQERRGTLSQADYTDGNALLFATSTRISSGRSSTM